MWIRFLIQCGLCLYLSVTTVNSTQRSSDVASRNTGCLHNNTLFADTSIIPSSEPCLLCKCVKKNLVCVRRVCKEQPYPPPRGCILVYKKSQCCPFLQCSKYHHINYYKNTEKNRGENFNQLQLNHEKTLEKNSRLESDDEEEMNGGCIVDGTLYASGSAMVRSSTSFCSYCFCFNGKQKCIKPKCLLSDTKCKPIFIEASCCPVKYDCTVNNSDQKQLESNKTSVVLRKNRSNGCYESGNKFYQEGEKLPSDLKRPCEICFCIKGFRKCVVKKCAPLLRGCRPKLPREGNNCCPTSYDCRRSLKITRQIQQRENEEPEEETDSLDFFSLLFGADETPEEEQTVVTDSTTLPPFKALPTTEKSFFDFIRAGLEIIDANADKIGSSINGNMNVLPTPKNNLENEKDKKSTIPKNEITQSSTIETITEQPTTLKTTTSKTSTTTQRVTTSTKRAISTIKPPSLSTDISSTSKAPTTKAATIKSSGITAAKSTSKADVTSKHPSTKPTVTSTRRVEQTSTKLLPTTTLRETTPKVLIETTTIPSRATTSKLMLTTTEGHQQHEFTIVQSDTKFIETDDNEAEAIPSIEIIPFVAHDAIDNDKFESYLKPYESLEKDYFANDNEKPFRYNNKFIHHGYDDYVYSNPHERIGIDNGPDYFETNENQFDSFSPPNEQDFLGGFSPKESIYDEASSSTIASELPLKNNEFSQKPLAPAVHEHKSNVTSTEKTLTFTINQTTIHKPEEEPNTIPNFKKISTNFTSFIDDLLLETSTKELTTTSTTMTTLKPTFSTSSTSEPVKSIINDDDFIIKHLKTPVAPVVKHTLKTEIFSKHTSPTMNGLLKLAGCNIYGQMYAVGHRIEELSNACLECRCLNDIGVGCTQKC